MTIEFYCASCGHRIVADDASRGERQDCPHPACGRRVRVPGDRDALAGPYFEEASDLVRSESTSELPAAFSIETVPTERIVGDRRGGERLLTEEQREARRSRYLFWTMEGVFLLSLVTTILLSDRELFHDNLGGVLSRFFGFNLCYTLLLVAQGWFLKIACHLHNTQRESDTEQVRIPPLETAMLIGFLSVGGLLMFGYPLWGSRLPVGVRVVIGTGVWLAIWMVGVQFLLTDRDHERPSTSSSLAVMSLTQVLNLVLVGLLYGGYVAGGQMGLW